MNWVSFLILGVLVFLTWRAYVSGFIRELVSLGAVILAVPIAGLFYDDMVPKVEPIIDSETGAGLVSFLAILAGVIVAGQVVAHLLKRTVELLNLGAADQLAGGAFGLLKGILICQVVLVALVLFPEPDLRNDIDESSVATTLLDGTPLILAILPTAFETGVDIFLGGFDILRDTDHAIGPPPATNQPAP